MSDDNDPRAVESAKERIRGYYNIVADTNIETVASVLGEDPDRWIGAAAMLAVIEANTGVASYITDEMIVNVSDRTVTVGMVYVSLQKITGEHFRDHPVGRAASIKAGKLLQAAFPEFADGGTDA